MGEPGGTISLLREGREQGRKEGKVGTAGQEAKQNQVSLSIMAYHSTKQILAFTDTFLLFAQTIYRLASLQRHPPYCC